MYKNYFILFLSIFLIISSCSKNSDDNNDNDIVISEIELNLDRGNKVENNNVEKNEVPQDTQAQIAESIVTDPTDVFTNYFLSGRTELLSIKSSGSISAEDFELGQLYEKHFSSADEKDIIRICSDFFDSFENDQISLQLVFQSSKLEIEDYYNYFIKDKIDFNDITYGKPIISKDEAIVRIRINSKKIPAYVYLLKKSSIQWMVSGLELDLRPNADNNQFEKWFPSIKASPLGYN